MLSVCAFWLNKPKMQGISLLLSFSSSVVRTPVLPWLVKTGITGLPHFYQIKILGRRAVENSLNSNAYKDQEPGPLTQTKRSISGTR